MTSRALFRAERLLGLAGDEPVLGLETGSSTASLAIVAHGRVLGEFSRPVSSHAASIPEEVNELLSEAGVNLSDLAGVAVGTGPGSFTGLRVGLSYAKGLAMALRCAIVGLPSLDSVALSVMQSSGATVGQIVCPIVDARRGEVYAALYRVVSNGLEKLSDDMVATLEWLSQRIPAEAVLAGDHSAAAAGLLVSKLGRRVTVAGESELPPRGRFIAMMGAAAIACGDCDEVAALQPLYVRSPQATFKPRDAGLQAAGSGTEGLWSREKSSLSSDMRFTTRN